MWVRIIEDGIRKCRTALKNSPLKKSKPKTNEVVSNESKDGSKKSALKRFIKAVNIVSTVRASVVPKISQEVSLACSRALTNTLPDCASLLGELTSLKSLDDGRLNPFGDSTTFLNNNNSDQGNKTILFCLDAYSCEGRLGFGAWLLE